MAKHRHQSKAHKPRRNGSGAALRAPIAIPEKKPVITYGEPFIVLEDEQKRTFVFSGGRWSPHSATIAECRLDCQIKQLPQKINGMTRYEVRSPV